jgi:hypothetical protein
MTLAAAIIFLVALAVASGPLDPQYQVLGGPFDFRGQGGVLLVVNQLALTVTTLAVVGAGSLVVRFRRARGVERQQLRWVAWAAALAVLGAVVALGGVAVGATAVVTWAISSCLPSCRWQSGRHSPLSAVRPGPHHQPHPGLRPADAVAGIGLCRGGRGASASSWAGIPAWSWPPPPWPWRRCSSRPAAASSRRSTGASPPPPRHRPDDRRVQRSAAPADRPGHPDRRGAGRGRPDHAADPGVTVAAAIRQCVPGPAHPWRIRSGLAAGGARTVRTAL